MKGPHPYQKIKKENKHAGIWPAGEYPGLDRDILLPANLSPLEGLNYKLLLLIIAAPEESHADLMRSCRSRVLMLYTCNRKHGHNNKKENGDIWLLFAPLHF